MSCELLMLMAVPSIGNDVACGTRLTRTSFRCFHLSTQNVNIPNSVYRPLHLSTQNQPRRFLLRHEDGDKPREYRKLSEIAEETALASLADRKPTFTLRVFFVGHDTEWRDRAEMMPLYSTTRVA